MFTDTQAITIIIPAEQTPTGIDKVLASFSFKELVDNVFSKNDALWYNPTNSAEHRTLTEAFTMRLFRGQLVKFENPKDNRIVDIFGQGKAGLAASERALHELLEYESTLWSY